ncbi:hypothetical protein [Herpetosiphon gulosus]|uniref:DNA methyltransferase n=1 Tax=Herpetosiphon gulosus TaxID=1973496 RepID=A0ABP9X994_9CHLR
MDNQYQIHFAKAIQKAEIIYNSEKPDDEIKYHLDNNKSLHHKLKDNINGLIIETQKTIKDGVETIINNLNKSKYIYSILLTGLFQKLINPKQDIRMAQEKLVGGYSNRSVDQIHITPLLKKYNFTHCATSGMESGRNWERPEPHTFGHSANSRGKGTKESYLGIIHAVQEEGIDPFPIIVLLLALDRLNRKVPVFEYNQPQGLTIEEIWQAVLRYHKDAIGNGRSRLPVLAIYAIYKALMPQVTRYTGMILRSPNRHTGNDKKGWIGDIQVDREDGTPYEAVEVKSGHQITPSMLRELTRKFGGQNVDRYYILSTEDQYIALENHSEIQEVCDEIRTQTGCQVIPNGLNRTLWYYLRLLENPDIFIEYYTQQINEDIDVQMHHRMLWAQILSEMNIGDPQ